MGVPAPLGAFLRRRGHAAALIATAVGAALFATVPSWGVGDWFESAMLSALVLLLGYVSYLLAKLSSAKAEAELANRGKTMFLASVSHELRTPLNAIIGLSEMMRGTTLDPSQREMNDTIGSAGRSLLTMITSILDYSRLEMGAPEPAEQAFDLHALLARTVRLLSVPARQKSLRLGLHMEPGVPAAVLGHERQLEEILLNLVGNAVKFTDRGSVLIDVACSAGNDGGARLRIAISDTGIGIAPDAQARIFESFTQADDGIMDRYGGSGLGLAIVRQLVERRGGRIVLESTPGEGSTFTVEMEVSALPAVDAAAPAAPVLVLSNDERLSASLRGAGLDVLAMPFEAAEAMTPGRVAAHLRHPVLVIDGRSGVTPARVVDVWSENAGTVFAPAAVLLRPSASEPLSRDERLRTRTALAPDASPSDIAAAVAMAAAGAPVEPPAVVESTATRPARSTFSVLVAEDNGTNQRVIERILGACGCEVTLVGNGQLALEALAVSTFDLVLMDINMPVLNGVEATRLFRFTSRGRERTPVIALTADATGEARRRCLEAGMDDCLLKPFEPRELVRLVEAVARGDGPAFGHPDPAQEAAPLSSGAAIEPEALERLEALGGADFAAEVCRQFASDSRALLEEIGAAVRACDAPAFQDRIHALRSCAANVGARAVFELCLGWRSADTARLREEGPGMQRTLTREVRRAGAALAPRLAPDGRSSRAG